MQEPVRPTATTTTVQANTTEGTSVSKSSGRRMKASATTAKSTVAASVPLSEAGSSIQSPGQAAVTKPKTEFLTLTSHVPGGHEIILVGEGVGVPLSLQIYLPFVIQ